MPIKPENKIRYPTNWKEISLQIRKNAGNRCEICGVRNYEIGYRNKNGKWNKIEQSIAGDIQAEDAMMAGYKIIRIILTVMHLDHMPENCKPENLKATCQKCHNNYDIGHRKMTRHITRRKKGIELPMDWYT